MVVNLLVVELSSGPFYIVNVTRMNVVRLLAPVLLSATTLLVAAQQQQTPPPVGQQKPGEPAQPVPQNAADQEAARNFLAIGAPPDPAAVKRGQAIFVSTCGFCHGTNANGGQSGPTLVRSVVVLHDQGTGKEIGPVVHNGRPGKGMPAFPSMTDAQIHDIAAFLLSRTQAAANRMDYTIQNIVTGDPKSGEAYFAAHCQSCHSATGDLAHVASKYDPVALEGRFLYPGSSNGGSETRALKKVTVTLPSGQSYSGVLVHMDDFSVALREPSGVYRSWVYDDVKGMRTEVEDPLKAHIELLHQYTDADMHNILAYLETLK